MESILTRLRDLKVADCMNRNVVPVLAHQTMEEAANLLIEHSISGGPVVNDQGRCVGMLSAVDFMRQQTQSNVAHPASAYALSHDGMEDEHDVPLEIDEIFHETVSRYMSSAVQSVRAETPLLAAARIMCGCHVHRLPVLDSDGRPEGMITSIDLTAALVHLVDEAEQERHRGGAARS